MHIHVSNSLVHRANAILGIVFVWEDSWPRTSENLPERMFHTNGKTVHVQYHVVSLKKIYQMMFVCEKNYPAALGWNKL